MNEINPITRLYTDIINILNSMTIKYSVKADEFETMESKSKGDRYINALMKKDVFTMYDDYTVQEYIDSGVTDENLIRQYRENRFIVPVSIQKKLIALRRDREIRDYEEQNNYYRMLNGYPDIENTDFVYVSKEYCEKYDIPEDLPIHKISDTMGDFYITLLEGEGYLDEVAKEHSDKEYLKHLGSKRISIQYARNAKNFAILSINQEEIMESTYREFIRSYEKARLYFISTAYNYQFRTLIPYYDNFIALCIFIMAIQQVSVRSIANATQREFYDEYMVQLLYETYGVPYFSKIDSVTQKQIVQNLNLLVQNKATNKVVLDIASILGFNDISIYQYFLVKKQKFDKNGRPIIAKKKRVNPSTGKEEEVYDQKAMKSVYFQKVDFDEENVKDALIDSVNRAEYSDITYYDPYWWEDDELNSEIWDSEYNYMETKYMGITMPYRMTEVLFQAIILLRLIMEKKDDLSTLMVQIPKISEDSISLSDAVILYFALIAKKNHLSGQILSTPSKLIHALETIDQDINKENHHIEVLGFNFDAFSPKNIEKMKSILEPYLVRRDYRVVNGHDVDLREDGTQDPFAPTHKVSYEINTSDFDEFCKYLTQLSANGLSGPNKAYALNKLYENIDMLYAFLSYHISTTNDKEEYYALKQFYDAAFYTNETAEVFKITTEEGERPAETFEEYFMYTNADIYEFIKNVKEDDIYSYINHIIYKIEGLVNYVGSLYVLNDGSSPLVELLQVLINFFKAYRMDLVELSSRMIIDWDMENTMKFFSHPQHIKKVNQVEERFGSDFMDLVHQFLVTYKIEDRVKLSDYIAAHAKIHIEDENLMHDMNEYVRASKINAINDYIEHYDTIAGIKETIKASDDLLFEDFCVKKEIKEEETE